MITEVKVGQEWASWFAGKRQWLLCTVAAIEVDQVTLQYSPIYELVLAERELHADKATMLETPNLFRFVRDGV